MKPTNIKSQGCDPVSSNCVIWQGPDLPCINLCKGDSVSDVVYNIAVELCKIQDQLTITGENYDLSCFNLISCTPDTFPKLLQFILDRLCAVEKCAGCIPDCNGNTPTISNTGTGDNGCPDCEVPIAPCFQFTNGIGDTVTTLQLLDYVTAIANRVCSLGGNTTTNTSSINNLGERVTNVEDGVQSLQDNQYIEPTLIPTCVLPPDPTSLQDLVIALETQFCTLQQATGSSTDIFLNIAKQCTGLNTSPALGPYGGNMSALTGWSTTVDNLATALGNLYVGYCDLRAAIQNIQINCCPTACSGITLSLFGIYDSGAEIMNVVVNGTIPGGFSQCSGNTVIKISDTTGNYITVTFDLIGYLNNPTGYPVSLGGTILNTALDLTIEIEPCLTDETNTCESYLSYVYSNSPICPVVTLVPFQTSVQYSFVTQPGNFTYTMEVYDETGTVLITSNVFISTALTPVSGTIVGLGSSTLYKFRVSVVATSCPTCPTIVCPFQDFETLLGVCAPPEGVSAIITWEPPI